MRERIGQSIESLDSLKEKAEFTGRQARLSEDLLIASEIREAKLKEELLASQHHAQWLEA